MCGIVGIYAPEREQRFDPLLLRSMARQVAHRGPDDSGAFAAAGVAFGFRRLSIVDLTGGNQPHADETGTIVSVCNGEIYNFRELRRELESKGHRLRGNCDVEILPHLYEDHGTDFIRRLNGQFAFALYDAGRHELILARDHAGIAPLFWTRCGDAWLFASEIKALLQHPGVERRVDLRGLDQILTFPGLVSPTTMFSGIHALPPGHVLRIGRDGPRLLQYWDLVYPQRGDAAAGDECADLVTLEGLLLDSVHRRLQADVPVGLYLSGGLDSSLVAALAHKVRPDERFHTYSITFPQADIDERRWQHEMAARIDSVHHEAEFSPDAIVERLRQAVVCAEAPLKESYDTCSLALSASVQASGHKVVLTGEGADELFAGYVGYRLDAADVRGNGDGGLEHMLEDEVRERLWGDPGFFYERDYLRFAEAKQAIYASDAAARLASFECTREPVIDPAKVRGRHPLHQRSYVDFKLRLADHLLADHGDRVAYAHSVEARYPFLDLDLLAFVPTVAPDLLVKDAREKYLLRAVAARHLPPRLAAREKFGFVAPGSPYLVRRRIDWIEDMLSPARIRRQNYFDADTVERLRVRSADGGLQVNATFDTDLLMLVLTFGIFLDAFELPDFSG